MSVHLCVDVQRLFAPGTDRALPWMEKVAPNIVRLCVMGPGKTIFTRFIPLDDRARAKEPSGATIPGGPQRRWR